MDTRTAGVAMLSSARGSVALATDFGALGGRISREELMERTGADSGFITELMRNGLLSAGAGDSSTRMPCAWSRPRAALADYGLQTRHLRAFKVSADREAGLVGQIANPIAKGKGDRRTRPCRRAGARDRRTLGHPPHAAGEGGPSATSFRLRRGRVDLAVWARWKSWASASESPAAQPVLLLGGRR